tara:strand:+ start:968 stop:3082 length:2115 start_codon:yes stop_codon:yes gene_type:complete
MKKIEKFVNLTRKLNFGKTTLSEAMSQKDKMLFAKCKVDGGSDEYCKQEVLRQKGEVDFDKYARATLAQVDSDLSYMSKESPEDQFRTFLKSAGSKDSKYDLSTLNKIANYVLPIGNKIAGNLSDLPDKVSFKISSSPRFNPILKDFITKGLQNQRDLSNTDGFVDASSFFFDTASDIDGALIYSISDGSRGMVLVNLDSMNEGDFGVFKKQFFDKIPYDKTGRALTEKNSRVIKEAVNYTNFYKPKKSDKKNFPYFSLHRTPVSEDLVRILYFYKNFYSFSTVDLAGLLESHELLSAFKSKTHGGEDSKQKLRDEITILKSIPFDDLPKPDELTSMMTHVKDSQSWYEENGYPTEIEVKLDYKIPPEEIFDILKILNHSHALTNVKFKIKSAIAGAQKGDKKPKKGATYNRLQNNILAYFEENPPYYDYSIGKHVFGENNIKESLKRLVKPRLITEDWSEVPALFARAQATGAGLVKSNDVLTLQDESWSSALKEKIALLIIQIQSHNYPGASVPMEEDKYQAQRKQENGSDWKRFADGNDRNFLKQYHEKLKQENAIIDDLVNYEDFWRFQTVYQDIRPALEKYIQTTETDEAYDFIKNYVGDLIELSESLAGGTGDPEKVLERFPTFFTRYEVLKMMVDPQIRKTWQVDNIMLKFASVGEGLNKLQKALKQNAEQQTDEVPEVREQLQKKKRVKIKIRYKK